MIDTFELNFPARPELLFMARLQVGAAASLADMPIEDIEDLHLAVEELCLSVLGASHTEGGRLSLSICLEVDSIEVSCNLTGGHLRDPAASAESASTGLTGVLEYTKAFSTQILDSLVDDHGIAQTNGTSTAWLKKKLP